MICKICNKEMKSMLGLSLHLTYKHKYNGGLVQYYIDYEGFEIPKCHYCNNNAKLEKGIKFRKTCGSVECLEKDFHNKKVDEDTRKKISKSMVNAHKNGNHPGWSFVNEDLNKRSYPEKWFIKNVVEKYYLYSKYTIKEKMPFHKYFLDFAILEMKIDIEIDGQQHFRSKEAIEHDKERDDFLIKNGWKVYRLAWLEIKKDYKIVEHLVNWLNDNKNYRKYDVEELLKSLKKNDLVYGSREKYSESIKNKTKEKYQFFIDFIKTSDIDFSKFGWVKKVSDKTGIKQQKINNWMKRYLNDFYDEKCFKKKAP